MPFRSKIQKIGRYLFNKDLYKNIATSAFRIRQLKQPPIIVCGAPRSGTTLLISILDSHPEILAIPYETWLLVNKKKQRWFPWDAWNKAFLFLQLKAILLSLPIKRTQSRWCEKTPDNVLYLDFIFSLFAKRPKVIHLVRDGRDVVMSHHKQLGQFMTPEKWVNYVRAGLKYKQDPDVLTVRYEDIIMDFGPSMKLISDFVGIENSFQKDFYNSTKINDNQSVISGYGYKDIYKAKPLSNDSLSKWKNSPEVIERFKAYPPAMDLLKELNYE